MKKTLYTTTALAAAGVLAFGATDASAASKAKKMTIGLGGFMKSMVSYSKQDASFESTASATSRTGYEAFDIKNDSEIYFRGTSKLDNGIGVSVTVQMEADAVSGGATIDESYLKLTGGFGDIRIGSTKAASFVLKHAAPGGVGAIGLGNPDASLFIVRPSADATGAGSSTHIGGGDSMKLVYITPKFSGFRAGASYVPSNTNSNAMPATGGTAGTETQTYDAMIQYENKLGSVNLKADVGYFETHGQASASLKAWRGGITLGFGAITVGGSYQDLEDLDSNQTGNAREAFDVGIQYAAGAYKIGVQYLSISSPQTAAVTGDDESTKVALGASYNMGPGVDLLGTILYVDWDDETTADANNNSGWAAIGGIKVSF